ncbi:hypothetical protein TCAL_06764, partial [Tigriopus californicus]
SGSVTSETPEPRRSTRLSLARGHASGGRVVPDTPTSPVHHPTHILETPDSQPGPGRPTGLDVPRPRRIQHPVFAQASPHRGSAARPRSYVAATQEATAQAKVDQWLQSQASPSPGPASGLSPTLRTCRLDSPMHLTPANINARLDLETEVTFRPHAGISVTDLSTDSAQALIAQWEDRGAGPERPTPGVASTQILASVVACVQVRSRHENRSKFVEEELARLGALITGNLTKKTTHLIFKDGSLSTYNKAKRQGCFIVSVRWVLTSRDLGYRADESQFPSVSCSQYDSPGLFPKLRKLKSMQPKSDDEMRQWIEARSRRRAKGREPSFIGPPEASPLFRPGPPLQWVPPIERSQDKDDILNILDELRSPMLWTSPKPATPRAAGTPLGSPCSSEDFDTPLARRLVKKYFRTPVPDPPGTPLSRSNSNGASTPGLRSPLTRPNGTEPEPQNDPGHSSPEPESASEPASSPFFAKAKGLSSSCDRNIDPPRRNLAADGWLAEEKMGKQCREASLWQNREEKKALITPNKPIQPVIKKNLKFKKRHQLFSQNDLLSETPDLVQTDVLKPIVENVHTQVAVKTVPKTKSKTKIIKDRSRIVMAQPPRRTQIKEPTKHIRKEKKVKCPNVTSSTASSSSSFPTQARRIQPSRRSSVEFMTPKVKKCPKRPLWSEIVCTACSEEELTVTRQVLNTLGKFKLASKVTPSTSHVIVGGDQGRWRTINWLKGVLQGCWIVSIQWVRDCLEHAYHVDEEPYERVDLSTAVQRCRLDRTSFGQDVYKSDLFASVGPVYIRASRTHQVSRTELKELVQLGGGQVVKRAREAHVIIGESEKTVDIGGGKTHLLESWILDSIQHHEIQPVSDYLLQSA